MEESLRAERLSGSFLVSVLNEVIEEVDSGGTLSIRTVMSTANDHSYENMNEELLTATNEMSFRPSPWLMLGLRRLLMFVVISLIDQIISVLSKITIIQIIKK